MGWWTDIAERHEQSPNVGGPMIEQRGLVVHIAEGSYEGTISWQMNPSADVSSHFVVAKDGRITQCVDTDVTAWTQRDGNGKWLSVENEGFTPNPLTDAQLSANARIFAKAAEVYGCPLVIANSPADRGLGHHSMGAENGYDWGHSQCPGDNIKAQKPEIVARAKGDDMPLNDDDKAWLRANIPPAVWDPKFSAVRRPAWSDVSEAENVGARSALYYIWDGQDPSAQAAPIGTLSDADKDDIACRVADLLAQRLTE